MQKFHYDHIKNKYGNNSRVLLLFTDTDSLMYEIQNEDVYESFGKDKEIMILAIIHLSQNIMMIQTNYLLVR